MIRVGQSIFFNAAVRFTPKRSANQHSRSDAGRRFHASGDKAIDRALGLRLANNGAHHPAQIFGLMRLIDPVSCRNAAPQTTLSAAPRSRTGSRRHQLRRPEIEIGKLRAQREHRMASIFRRDNELGRDFGLRNLPTVALVDKAGVLRFANARNEVSERVRERLVE